MCRASDLCTVATSRFNAHSRHYRCDTSRAYFTHTAGIADTIRYAYSFIRLCKLFDSLPFSVPYSSYSSYSLWANSCSYRFSGFFRCHVTQTHRVSFLSFTVWMHSVFAFYFLEE
jgi:hypothetical protein